MMPPSPTATHVFASLDATPYRFAVVCDTCATQPESTAPQRAAGMRSTTTRRTPSDFISIPFRSMHAVRAHAPRCRGATGDRPDGRRVRGTLRRVPAWAGRDDRSLPMLHVTCTDYARHARETSAARREVNMV